LLSIPSGWTAPTNKGAATGPGRLSVTATSCSKAKVGKVKGHGPWTVSVAISCQAGKGFSLGYGDATVPTTAGPVTFPSSLKVGKTTEPLDQSPSITIGPGPLDHLVLQGSRSSVAPYRGLGAPNALYEGIFTSQYTAEGFDQYGNDIGDVTNDATYAVGGGSCSFNSCMVFSDGPETVVGTDGTASGEATLTGDESLFSMVCEGENFDVNGNIADGCEQRQSPQGNHTVSTAAPEGSFSDCDTPFSYGGDLFSDDRLHQDPAVVGFDPSTGSAPAWTSFVGVGHTFCENDLVLTLQMSGSANPSCYKFTVISDEEMYSVGTDPEGTASIDQDDGGQFSDDSTIRVDVQKTCSTSVTEAATYTISGHL
jgi:hypothetical protein